MLPLGIVLAVVLIGGAAGLFLLTGSGGSNQSQGGGASTTASATGPTSRPPATSPRTSSSAPASTPASSSSSTAPSTSATSAAGGRTTDADLAAAVQQYFQLVPGNLDAGWARLTPHFQNGRAQSRQVFDDYWNSIDRVDTADVQGQAPHSASARLTYHYKDGRVVTQQTSFRFVKQDGVLKIDDEN
ncbi:hypothetical protein [uncultured Jatrophihabitans sp.]|uniref:hypothetical protein n=1 Tax=uncultured Jatrophihabitans sp. TaxID=1610747 RepID=UPI0035CA59F0